MLLVDKATFPRDKPCGGGMTLRAVRQCPVDPTPVVEESIDQVELRFRYRTPSCIARRRAGRLDDAAAAARRVPARRGARARGGGARGRQGRGRAGQRRRARRRASVSSPTRSSAPTGRTGSRPARSGSATGSPTASRTRGTCRTRRSSRERYARRLVLELADIPGGYAWVLPEGRPRERRRRRLAERGAEAPRASAARLRGARARPRRASRACAATGCRCGAPARGSRASARSSSATRPV